jgi:hypothetical protein
MRMLARESAAGLAAMTQAAHQAAGRITLVAVAVVAVGAFTVLQIMAASGRRPPAARRRRPRAGHDWRTLPPAYDDPEYEDPACEDVAHEDVAGTRGMTGTDHDGYGPLWRYGAPRGYGRDYGPGHRPGSGPGYPTS